MEIFFSTWLSYFVLGFLALTAWGCIHLRTANPFRIAMFLFVPGGYGFGILFLPVLIFGSLALALISKYDPLAWLWASIAHFYATADPYPISRPNH